MNKILLVEDNLVNQKVAQILLEQLGMTSDVASNGKEALERVGSQNYSAILMDCQMPEMDGFETTVAIRKLETETGHYTPIIAVTALSMAGDIDRCISAGMDDYIPKPINKEMLRIKLSHWLKSDVVYRNQKLSRLYSKQTASVSVINKAPVDLEELKDFYGEVELLEILRIFLTSTEQSLQRLRANILERNRASVARMAHELKASCASIGAKQLAKLALFLEQATGQEDWAEVNQVQAEITTSFEQLQMYLKGELNL